MKKLHLLEDSVYANWYVSNCKLYNDNTTENVFVCIKNEVSYIKDETVIVCNEGGEYYKQLIDQINSDIYRTVFVNFLDIKKANFINSTTNTKVKFVWILWGGDLYALTKYKFNIYEGFSKNS
jgi:hypothetical protein